MMFGGSVTSMRVSSRPSVSAFCGAQAASLPSGALSRVIDVSVGLAFSGSLVR
jgi:hypothetical protein